MIFLRSSQGGMAMTGINRPSALAFGMATLVLVPQARWR
jgi:hypothetical protein